MCASEDGVTGVGDPGGKCHACKFQRWTDEGEPPECDERRAVFLLKPGEWLPLFLDLPRKSAEVLEATLARLSAKCISIYGVLIELKLERVTNPQNQVYSKLTVSVTGRLSPEDLALSRAYRATMEGSLKAVAAEPTRGDEAASS